MEGDENYGSVDNDHLETMFVAMDDTMGGVTGSEGFGLTHAQKYAYGVLDASDSLSRVQKVDGNESFFGKIADGLQAVWEYIKKMFKNIWGFFFGGSGKESAADKIQAADKRVADADKALKRVAMVNGIELQREMTANLVTVVKQVATDPETPSSDKKVAEELVQELHTTPPPAGPEIKRISERFAKINHKQQKRLEDGFTLVKGKAEYLIAHITQLHGSMDKHEDVGEAYQSYKIIIGDLFEHDVREIRSALNSIHDGLAIYDVGQGARALQVIKLQLKPLVRINSFIKVNKGVMEHRMKECEKALNFKGDHAELKAKARAELAVVKDMMSAVNATTTYTDDTCHAIEGLCSTVCRIFGIKP